MSAPVASAIDYPDQDGIPLSDNTLQFQWIMMLQGGLDAQFRDDPNVFVAGDLLWYPVEGRPDIRQAPDVMVVLGRPKGYRGSYRQWVEGGVAPQVVFEILSPSNRKGDLLRRFQFFERYGVEEYYVYDPDHLVLDGWQRQGNVLHKIDPMNGWTSPLLGIRFVQDDSGELTVLHPDGRRFLTFVEVDEERENAAEARRKAEDAAETLRQQLKALGIDPQA